MNQRIRANGANATVLVPFKRCEGQRDGKSRIMCSRPTSTYTSESKYASTSLTAFAQDNMQVVKFSSVSIYEA